MGVGSRDQLCASALWGGSPKGRGAGSTLLLPWKKGLVLSKVLSYSNIL